MLLEAKREDIWEQTFRKGKTQMDTNTILKTRKELILES